MLRAPVNLICSAGRMNGPVEARTNMCDDKPDITSFERAIERLREGLAQHQANTTNTLMRDGVLRRFEFSYSAGCKVLKRYLKYAAASSEHIELMEFPSLIRTANEQSLLLGDWPRWRGFRDMLRKRNYFFDDEVADEVAAGVPLFLEEAIYLRDRLRERLA